jgi:hypothetical protein
VQSTAQKQMPAPVAQRRTGQVVNFRVSAVGQVSGNLPQARGRYEECAVRAVSYARPESARTVLKNDSIPDEPACFFRRQAVGACPCCRVDLAGQGGEYRPVGPIQLGPGMLAPQQADWLSEVNPRV